jgi:chitin synthase
MNQVCYHSPGCVSCSWLTINPVGWLHQLFGLVALQIHTPNFVNTKMEFDNRHGPIQRHKSTVHRVKAQQGNFVFFFPVSQKLLVDVQYSKGDDEYTHTKYTAVTCDPDQFPLKYQLRAARNQRQTKIALVITMYNETNDLFVKSMKAVQKNIAYLCSKDKWGPDGWKNFLVVIVSDGRTKINPEVLNTLAVMGCFVPGLPRTSVNDMPVNVHLFEFTTQVMVDRTYDIKSRADNVFPMQVCFVLKEKNAKKINSHKWFFNAICESIQPEVTMLLDVGTKPSDTSFHHLYEAFARDPTVGGACGEIVAEIGAWGSKLINPLVHHKISSTKCQTYWTSHWNQFLDTFPCYLVHFQRTDTLH